MSNDMNAEEVGEEIARAFSASRLSWHDALKGTTYLDAAALETGIEGQTWRTLELAFLEFHHDALLFLEPSLFAAILPAFLLAVVQHSSELDQLPLHLATALTRERSPERFDERVAVLTALQQKAIAHVLGFLQQHSTGLERKQATAALDGYWSNFADQKGRG